MDLGILAHLQIQASYSSSLTCEASEQSPKVNSIYDRAETFCVMSGAIKGSSWLLQSGLSELNASCIALTCFALIWPIFGLSH